MATLSREINVDTDTDANTGTVAVGAAWISVCNPPQSTAEATFDGMAVPPGVAHTYPHKPGEHYGAKAYDASTAGARLLIIASY